MSRRPIHPTTNDPRGPIIMNPFNIVLTETLVEERHAELRRVARPTRPRRDIEQRRQRQRRWRFR
jgi:hypothetical protein